MPYAVAKKQGYKNLMKSIAEAQARGEEPQVAEKMWCEFCGHDKKRWEISLVKGDQQDKIKSNSVANMLEGTKTDFLLSCENCIDALDLKLLKDDHAGKFDGEKLAMCELLETAKQ